MISIKYDFPPLARARERARTLVFLAGSGQFFFFLLLLLFVFVVFFFFCCLLLSSTSLSSRWLLSSLRSLTFPRSLPPGLPLLPRG